MAAANSDQENVLLQSDEGSPSAPPPAGRFPFKAPLAVGLCIFAAGLAGAVTIWRPAARAPAKIGHPWSAIGLVHDLEHVGDECQEQYEALAKEAKAEGRVQETEGTVAEGGLPDCTPDEQTCTIEVAHVGTHTHCWPAICKEENIEKQIEHNYDGFNVDVSCTVQSLGNDADTASEEDEGDPDDPGDYQCCFWSLVISFGCQDYKPLYIPWCPAE